MSKFRFMLRNGCLISALIFGAVLAGGCRSATVPEVVLTFLSINDLHGALESTATDRETGRPLGGGGSIAAMIEGERGENPQGTLLFDGGDFMHGTALANLTKGKAVIDFMNAIGFDAAVLGNHEFAWGAETLGKRLQEAEFPVLAANLIDRATGELPPWVEPYVIVERQGLRIAVIGLLTRGTPLTALPQNVEPFEFQEPAEVARRWIDELVPARADLAVLLCHIGMWNDPEMARLHGDLRDMTDAVMDASAIITGHTHRQLMTEINEIPVIEAGARGRFLGRLDLRFDPKKRQVVGHDAQIIPIWSDELPPDPEVVKLIEGHRQTVDGILDEVVAEASSAIERTPEPSGESAIGNLFVDALRERSDVTFVFQNVRGIRAGLAAGPIRRRDLYKVMPFDNTIVRVSMRGREVKALLEQAAETKEVLYVSGLRYIADWSRPVGDRVTIDPPLEEEGLYPVVVNDFMVQGGDGLTVLANLADSDRTGILLRDAFAEWLRIETEAGRKISAEVNGRIAIKDPP